MLFFGAIAAAVLGGWLYVKGLQKDLAIAKENMFKLEQAHQQQQKVIEQQRIDFEAIVQANKKIVEENKRLEKEYHLEVNINSTINKLPVGLQQRV